MTKKPCPLCAHNGDKRNYARHMRKAHHQYPGETHLNYVMGKEHTTRNTALLLCSCKHRLKMGANDWWTMWTLAKESLANQQRLQGEGWVMVCSFRAIEPILLRPIRFFINDVEHLPTENELVDGVEVVQQADEFDNSPAENELVDEAEVVHQADEFDNSPAENELVDEAELTQQADDFADLPAEDKLVGNKAEVVEHDNDLADLAEGGKIEHSNDSGDLPADDKLVDKKTEEHLSIRPSGYTSLPAMGDYASIPNEPKPRIILRPVPQLDEDHRQRHFQLQDDALPHNQGVQEIATFDKALWTNRVTSIACIRMVEEDNTINSAPALTEITCGSDFDAVRVASEFAPKMASLLADHDAKPLWFCFSVAGPGAERHGSGNLLEPL
ncbi:hypothetical protein FN846DRAFT_889786 [Sphaerosporella brunnea]|uniref:Uncharacterized protein n=1 Tax=Sphaerosporella brunnea TaxID=1250544 RepID=A0A5J5EY54_9PEZI|nr:hypothetical protein FN846DRAFT_889786 [Sphaerosporella brunnea]